MATKTMRGRMPDRPRRPRRRRGTALGEDSHGLVVFTSGWGDGVYPSYWALDTSGISVALVTDFLCIQGGDGRDERELPTKPIATAFHPTKLKRWHGW